jgi:L-arabinose isomerase
MKGTHHDDTGSDTRDVRDPEIWVLTGSQGLYRDDTSSQVARQSRQIAERLNTAPRIPLRGA